MGGGVPVWLVPSQVLGPVLRSSGGGGGKEGLGGWGRGKGVGPNLWGTPTYPTLPLKIFFFRGGPQEADPRGRPGRWGPLRSRRRIFLSDIYLYRG